MEVKDAIMALERLRHTEAKWPGTEETPEALDMAVVALRLAPSPEQLRGVCWACGHAEPCANRPMYHGMIPLTLEQLLGMNGKPVWIVESPDWGHWELSEDAEDYICDRDTDLYGLKYPDPDGKAGLHKLGWVAYAYPPAHIAREPREFWEVRDGTDHK